MSIGQRIERRLLDLKWSQSRLARETGLPQTTVNSLIRKDARMTPHLGRIALALHTSPAYLTGEVDDPSLDYAEAPRLTQGEQAWLDIYRALDERSRDALLHIAQTMLTGSLVPALNFPEGVKP